MKPGRGPALGALAAALGLLAASPAGAVTQIPAEGAALPVEAAPPLRVDVWVNREEGGVYRPGESMRIYFRASADAFVLLYNIDTEGYIHLVYPYGPADPQRVQGGQTYRVPARHDPYEVVADGPPGMEFVVAVASRYPFVNLPWFLTGDQTRGAASDDELDAGVIVGDPYVGMERLNERIVPPGRDEDADATETYFYIGRRVEYPRYVCADCHYHAFGFDPYVSVCPVVDIRIDATWVRYAPVHVSVVRPRYYYYVRQSAPDRYRVWKDRWSSIDGSSALRSRFVVRPSERSVRERQLKWRREPSEFRDLRRSRPGRLWEGRDEILRLRERPQNENRSAEPRKNITRFPDRRNPESPFRRPGVRNEDGDRGQRGRDQDRPRYKDPARPRDPDQGRGGDRGRGREERWRDQPREERDRGRSQEDRPREQAPGERGRGRSEERGRERQEERGRGRQEERERGREDRGKGKDDRSADHSNRGDHGDQGRERGHGRGQGR